jgi:UPF0271 protein
MGFGQATRSWGSAARRCSLNIDLGELPGEPEELYALAMQANIACGGHAGDHASMRAACRLAVAFGATIAAHPSYPDRPNFGRRSMEISEATLRAAVSEQCSALVEIAREFGAPVRVVKPHGALYHDIGRNPALAAAFLAGIVDGLGAPDTLHLVTFEAGAGAAADAARALGIAVTFEGFADRGCDADGRLIARAAPGALIESAGVAADQAERLIAEGRVGTICVHGDTPNALSIARAVRARLDRIHAGASA